MHFPATLVLWAITFWATNAISIDHDKVKPFVKPEPVTISEKAGIKFKPRLSIRQGSASYPAVNEVGETSGGLKGNSGTSGCEGISLGSQMYGRAVWPNDIYAIMYAWYFPKGFWGPSPSRRHDWASVVVWVDNTAVESPKFLGLSLSESDTKYKKEPIAKVPTYGIDDGTTPKVFHTTWPFGGSAYIGHPEGYHSRRRGMIKDDTSAIATSTQDLIM